MNMRSVGLPTVKPLFRGDQKASAAQSNSAKAVQSSEEREEDNEFEEFMASLGTESRPEQDRFESTRQSQSARDAENAEKIKAYKERENALQHYWAKKTQGHIPSRLRNSFTAEDCFK